LKFFICVSFIKKTIVLVRKPE